MRMQGNVALLGASLVAMASGIPLANAQVYPERGLYEYSTGLVTSQFSSGNFRGSGVIARDSRLVYSCAHVLYQDGVWATSYRFHRAYHSESAPYSTDGVSPRGYRYFTSYAPYASEYGVDSNEAFSVDFIVYYADFSFGDAVGWWSDGGAVLRSNRWKRIVGYPSRLEYNGQQGYYYQHATDWFSNQADQVSHAYHWFSGVSTGPGNSGGPVFVYDSTTEKEYLAGILVSGLSTSAGVCALSDATNQMASNALGIESVTRTYANENRLRLPDAATRYSKRSITATGYNEGITGLTFSARINTLCRGELAAYLKSPSGRIRWISKPSGNLRRNLVITDRDLSNSFEGSTADGVWSLLMKDTKAGNPSVFRSFSVTITAPGTP